MEINLFELSIKSIIQSLPSSADFKRLKSLIAKKQWTELEGELILSNLAQILLKPQHTLKLASQCPNPLLLQLLFISAQKLSDCHTHASDNQQEIDAALELHENFLYALSQLNGRFPAIEKLCSWYTNKYPNSMFKLEAVQILEPVKKKPKKVKKSNKTFSPVTLLHAYFILLHNNADPSNYEINWDWSFLISLLEDSNLNIKCLAYHCLSKVVGLPEKVLQSAKSNLSMEDVLEFTLQNEDIFKSVNISTLNIPFLNEISSSSDCFYLKSLELVSSYKQLDDKFGLFTLCGASLVTDRSLNLENFETSVTNSFVLVPSLRQCLRDLLMAIKSNQPILLEGIVGCGKTSLVNFVARVMARDQSFMTGHMEVVQLGDQTDAKLLVGIYCCTDIPGEFVWKPGPLTRTLISGGWLLLEDINYASVDVITLLSSVVESRSLKIPGMVNPLKAASGFQIFATQRLVTSTDGILHSASKGSQHLLSNTWTRILVPNMSEAEMKEAINTRWPNLSKIADRIVNVFESVSNIPHVKGERKLSTRDLFKWCLRLAGNFSLLSQGGALSAFLHAYDCFCSCIQDLDTKLNLAGEIGAHLNIPREKTNHLCLRSKPDIKFQGSEVVIGRVTIPIKQCQSASLPKSSKTMFSFTRQASSVLETVASSVFFNEPVLLVGETGTGKTSIVQYLAHITGQKLSVINMNQQSDSADLLGGFKPVEFKITIAPIREQFEDLFNQTFSARKNSSFLKNIMDCFILGRWPDLVDLMIHVQKQALSFLKLKPRLEDASPRHTIEELLVKWSSHGQKLNHLKVKLKQVEKSLFFSFIPGSLVKAIKEGNWILLDEINLAETETLECLGKIMENDTINVFESGDESIMKHPNFRLFACMNPATDVGKKDLPVGIRNRFTEIYMEELNSKEELSILCQGYLRGLNLPKTVLQGVVTLYLNLKETASKTLTDGTGHSPHYSLRTLCRALNYASSNPCLNVHRSLYESFCLSFLTQLDRKSHSVVENMVSIHILGKDKQSLLKQKLPLPTHLTNVKPSTTFCKIEGYWIRKGSNVSHSPLNYILTATIKRNISDLSRIVSAMRFPVLIQGETSVGKTSLIEWLAQITGNVCIRVNNHEHTDLQEYIGNYVADENGKLVFKEGVLVEAMRQGYWIILDELNLAPTEVLEALNRVLDDNRELFVTETQRVVKAHPQFLLFATQNPPGLYGGRKVLSRAFRNRFVELHFDEIPSKELEEILGKRCSLPRSYCAKLVGVMLELQLRRRDSGVFAGKRGFITLRDLFRWGERYKRAYAPESQRFYDWDQHLADEGYLLLAGRVRRIEEEKVIIEVLQKHFKRTVNPIALFYPFGLPFSATTEEVLKTTVFSQSGANVEKENHGKMQKIVWTQSFSRLAVLVGQALRFGEPVLLVGETGCGKTTICEILANLYNKQLYSVNCHMHSESADFLGSLRPVRNKLESDKLFEWADGPLVKAMREGEMFLADEISLADDSVLERLNSVLEPEGTLLLAEKGNSADELNMHIVASEGFRFMATMNPGGDYGKKELSPALRNRFTEIWCATVSSTTDLQRIVDENLTSNTGNNDGNYEFGKNMMEFLDWFTRFPLSQRCIITVRDLLSWAQFMNCCCAIGMNPADAYIHGAQMTFIDSVGACLTSCGSHKEIVNLRDQSLKFLYQQMKISFNQELISKISVDSDQFGIQPFYIKKGSKDIIDEKFCFDAPTTNDNAFRLLRAMQVSKPILLEGSPGVGKTALVSSLAKLSGHHVVRINLSDQTDISELFGADLPVEGGKPGHFEWRDGPLLGALKSGHWLLLDELNLASQSVLEGLNACLDHRGQIYIPELDRTFKVPCDQTRLFACQNPQMQGGARKGLPRSFLNRFVQIYIEPLTSLDLQIILTSIFPSVNHSMIEKMVQFSMELDNTITSNSSFTTGGPWEFNLRDLMRWFQLIQAHNFSGIENFVQLIYADRMRTKADKEKVLSIFSTVFGTSASTPAPKLMVNKSYLQIGHSFIKRQISPSLFKINEDNQKILILNRQLKTLQSIAKCVEQNWMTILVGPSGTGKTSMIKLLSSLANHRLSVLHVNSEMDTTELLGGFEQADLSRNLERLWKTTDELVRERFWNLIGSQSPTSEDQHTLRNEILQTLLEKWKECRKHENASLLISTQPTAKLNSAESPFFTFAENVRGLLSVLIKTDVDNIAAKNLEIELVELESKFNSNQRSCDGGRFEWVDSQLVTAVKEGQWLLIDNANLCSASVLDRLNPLLEPNGVLAITEQGFIDGSVRTIVPHPEFRLFLTMDPKNGEISRAMRNRGIEIFMLDELAYRPLDEWDNRVILRSLGYQGQTLAIDTLLTLHKMMLEEKSFVEKPSISYLIQSAKLAIANVHEGLPFYYSLCKSVKHVYLHQALINPESKLELESKIDEVIKSTFGQEATDLISHNNENHTEQINNQPLSDSLAYYSNHDYSLNSLLTNVRREGQLVTYLLRYLQAKLAGCENTNISKFNNKLDETREKKDMWTLNFLADPVNWPSVIRQTVTIFLESSSFCDMALRLKWAKNSLDIFEDDSVGTLVSQMSESLIVKELLHFSRAICTRFSGSVFEEFDLLPLNLFCCPVVLRFITTKLSKEELEKLEWLCNRLRFSMVICQYKWSKPSHCVSSCQTRKIGNCVTCLFHMQSLSCESPVPLTARSLRSNSSRSSLARFFEELEKATMKAAEDLTHPFPSSLANALFESVWFLNQLWILCDQRDHKLVKSDQILSTLKLQWSWTNKHALPILLDFFKKTHIKTNDLDIASKQITAEIFPIVPEYHKLRAKIASLILIPEPFSCAQMANIFGVINSLEDLLSWNTVLALNNLKQWLDFTQNKPVIMEKLFNGLNNPDPEQMLNLVKSTMDEWQLLSRKPFNPVKMELDEDETSDDDYLILNPKAKVNLELLPIGEYMLSRIMAKIVSSVLGSQSLKVLPSPSNSITALIQSFLSNTEICSLVLSPSLFNLFLQAKKSTPKQLKKLTLPLFLKYFDNIQGSPSSFNFKGFLTVSQKYHPHSTSLKIDGHQIMPLSLMCCLVNESFLEPLSDIKIENVCLKKENMTKEENLKCHLPLGVYDEKIAQLQAFKLSLWRNLSLLDNSKIILDDMNIVKQWFRLLMVALHSIANNCSPVQEESIFDSVLDNLTLQSMVDLSLKAGLPGGEYGEFLQTANFAIKHLRSLTQNNLEGKIKDIECTTGIAWINIGYITATFFAPWDSIDPVQKHIHKLDFHKRYLGELSRSLELRDWLSRANAGISLTERNASDLPKWVLEEMDKRKHFSEKVTLLESKVAYRPESSQFSALSLEVKRFFTNLATVSKVNDMYFNLSQIKPRNCGPRASQVLQEVDVWLQSLVNFHKKLINNFLFYQDLIVPFALGIVQMIHGFKLLWKQSSANYSNFLLQLKSCDTLTNLSTSLGVFSYINEANPDPSSFVKELIRPDFLEDISKILGVKSHQEEIDMDGQSETIYVSNAIIIIRSALLELLNNTKMLSGFKGSISLCVREDNFKKISSVFSLFINLWEKEVEADKHRKEEENKVYQMKTFDAELPDEEISDLEIMEKFPDYLKEFSDIHNFETEDPITKEVPITREKKQETHMNEKQLLYLWNIHEVLIKSLENSVPNDEQQLNFTEPFMLRYKILTKVLNAGSHMLDHDPNILSSHILANHYVCTSQDENSFEMLRKNKFDVYHSSLPIESVKCRKVLDSLKEQIYQLLKDFPRHPALLRILTIIKRIFGFPISSPLMKFITGLEIVLEISQDWEQIAHRGISLKLHLSAISNLIIEWRKMELKCWSSALDSVVENHYLKASHWWARLYSLFLSEEKDWKTLLHTIIHFMEGSTIGQFQCRLQLISLFSKQYFLLTKFSTDVKSSKMVSDDHEMLYWMLHNIHCFYEQFSIQIVNHINLVRKPIEEKLKEFVKIAQWNDLNFYRVKAAVDKSHRTVHKYAKEFENSLLQPVKTLLVPQQSSPDKIFKNKDIRWSFSVISKDFVLFNWDNEIFKKKNVPKAMSVRSDSPLHCLRRLSRKMCTFANSVLDKSKVPNRIVSLDNSCGHIVESLKHIQIMDQGINQKQDKDERKKFVKFQYTLKKKALADLFKHLAELGLSFKKGLNISKQWQTMDELKLPILPISENFGLEDKLEKYVLNSNEGCEKYFHKAVAQLSLLLTKLQSPPKEVDLGSIHRCSGFCNHLMSLISENRKELYSVCKTYCRLKSDLRNLKRLSEEYQSKASEEKTCKKILPPQLCAQNWQIQLENMVIGTETVIHHFKCLWDACPSEMSSELLPIVFQSERHCDSSITSTLENIVYGDVNWVSVDSKLGSCLKRLQDIKNTLRKHPSEQGLSLFTWKDIQNLKISFKIFSKITKELSQICDICGSNGPIIQAICDCVRNIKQASLKFETEFEQELTDDSNKKIVRDCSQQMSTNVELRLDSVTRTILLATQAVIKESSEDESVDNVLNDCDLENDSLEKFHLTKVLIGYHTKIFEILRLSEIGKLITNLITSYVTIIWETNVTPSVMNNLVFFALKTLPLIEQYSNLVLFYFTTALATHRVSCKLLFLLSTIFSELAQKVNTRKLLSCFGCAVESKYETFRGCDQVLTQESQGFCIPEELQDEILDDKNQGTKFNEIEDGGLGEGKGAKDVSEKIESEDQLEDTLKEGEVKQKNNEDEDKENKADDSKGIEMSDDFEGEALDPEKETENENDDSVNSEEEHEIDKQMGDIDNEESEKLDEKLWGSESEDEDNVDNEEEYGDGSEKSKSEMVAKSEGKEEKQDPKSQNESPDEDKEINEIGQTDDYDDNAEESQRQPHEPEECGDIELPDDIQIDMDGGDGDDKQDEDEDDVNENVNENQMDEDDGQPVSENEQDVREENIEEDMPDDDNEDGKETGEKEKVESTDENESEIKPLSEAADTKANSSTETTVEGTGDNANESNNVKEDETQEHGQSSESKPEGNEKSNVGEGANSLEGQEELGSIGISACSDDGTNLKEKYNSSSKDLNRDRSLANKDSVERPLERKNTVNSDEKEKSESKNKNSSLYQHIREGEKFDTEILDLASEEEASKTQPANENSPKNEDSNNEMSMETIEVVEQNMDTMNVKKPMSVTKKSQDGRSKGLDERSDNLQEVEEAMEIVGDILPTYGAARGPDSTIHTRHDLWSASSLISQTIKEFPSLNTVDPVDVSEQAKISWRFCDRSVAPLVQELCEQLRLVLEPTKTAKLKGDYRTGKRLNMRKIIPYIASQFRKDKIWLRRTKPSKRQYQIAIAVDDSSSMADNQTRQMAFESIALLGKALSLLETGDLSIMKFGEDVSVLHSLGETFSDASGAKILQSFSFQQTKTRIAELLNASTKLLTTFQRPSTSNLGIVYTQLLIIVSDGRGVFNEGEDVVKNAMRNAKANNIFIVFIVLDNPSNKDSILDIKMPRFSEGRVTFHSYLEDFPFPFYVILREIKSMPVVLGEALRQWFELVTSSERQ